MTNWYIVALNVTNVSHLKADTMEFGYSSNLYQENYWAILAFTWMSTKVCMSTLSCTKRCKLNVQYIYRGKLKHVISNLNCTHSQRRMCTPCSEQVVCLINKLLNTTQTKNAFCKIKVMGHCALKSKQSWDNRWTDPGDRSYLLPSQLSIFYFFYFFPAGPCWRETI